MDVTAAPVRTIIAGHELDVLRPLQRGHVNGYWFIVARSVPGAKDGLGPNHRPRC